ncbi:MAG: sugar transporter ATP-binding protein [Blastococcus sp.]|jgi:ribose transport system ATP-binding protein|nr:sugar transporter ATP-binding protein [Blastococcus sp.]
MPEHPPVVALTHLSKSFGAVRALHDVDLTVRRGEVHGLLGENGSGKSTLIKILSGFHTPDTGSGLAVNGRPVSFPLHPGKFRSLGMSFVHQDLGLVPSLSVVENLLVGDLASRRRWRLSWPRERRRAAETFASFGLGLDPRAQVADLRPSDRALLAIVRAVQEIRAHTADDGSDYGLLVLDEPTVFLPARDRDQLFVLIRRIAATRASILFVSHDLDEIRGITDRVTVLRDGVVRGTVETARASGEVLVEMIIGRRLQALPIERKRTATGAAVSITGLNGRYARGVSLTVHRGEVVGLTGLLGSGFEEIPYYVFGARRAFAGRLAIDGRTYDLRAMSPSRALEAGVALLPADRHHDGSVGSLSLGDNVTVPALRKYRSRIGLNRRRMRSDARRLLAQFDVRPPDPRSTYQSLSGGNQQKALLAKWLQTKPSLLLLHEPTQGVDIRARQQIFRLTRKAAAGDTAVVCVSTDYDQLAAVCDRVVVFGRGRVGRELTGAEVTKERIAEQCYRVAENPSGRHLDAGGDA